MRSKPAGSASAGLTRAQPLASQRPWHFFETKPRVLPMPFPAQDLYTFAVGELGSRDYSVSAQRREG
jgi:hypothetical protein